MRYIALTILLAFAFGLSGCSSTVDVHNENEPVSAVPWNRPERGFETSPLGGMMPGAY